MIAFCGADGVIQFGKRCAPGTLPILAGPARVVRRTIAGAARLAYDNRTYLVPGIPEAKGRQDLAMTALLAFVRRLRLSRTVRRQVSGVPSRQVAA